MTDELKPCPFCGCKEWQECLNSRGWIRCGHCKASVQGRLLNTRPLEGALRAEVERLKAECDHRDEGIAAWRDKCREAENEIALLSAKNNYYRSVLTIDGGKWRAIPVPGQSSTVVDDIAPERVTDIVEERDRLRAHIAKGGA